MASNVKKENRTSEGNITTSFIQKYFQHGSVDLLFLIIVLLLLGTGLIMMFSASYPSSYAETGTSTYYIKKQALGAVLGLVIMFALSLIKTDFWKTKFVLNAIAVGSYVLLVAVLAGGDGDIKRWIHIGSFGFQPSELSKFAIVLIGAYLYSKHYSKISSSRIYKHGFVGNLNIMFSEKINKKDKKIYLHEGWVPTVYHVFFFMTTAALVVVGSHLSAFIIMCLIGGAMMFFGGVRMRWFVAVLAVVVLAVSIVCIPIKMTVEEKNDLIAAGELSKGEEADNYVVENVKIPFIKGYQVKRIIAWIDKDYSPRGARWQQNQGLYAVGSGGFFGKGLGNSTQKYLYVSEPHNDMVFTIVCEELGFLGATLIIIGFACLVSRGLKIGINARTRFGGLLAMGLSLLIGLQALLNIAVATELIPNTGISMPFFSYGGTALIVYLAEAGIVLSVSRDSRMSKK